MDAAGLEVLARHLRDDFLRADPQGSLGAFPDQTDDRLPSEGQSGATDRHLREQAHTDANCDTGEDMNPTLLLPGVA